MRSRSSVEQDYLLRLIQQAAEALRRLRGRLAAGDAAEVVRQDAAAATGDLLGAAGPMLTRLDPESAARLLGDPDRVEMWACLLELEAEALAAVGDRSLAESARKRSAALRAAAARLWRSRDAGEDSS